MKNAEKFIEVMNEYFDAGLTKENLETKNVNYRWCSPCGVFRKGACDSFTCKGWFNWWDKEWKPKGGASKSEKILPIPCTKVEEKTVKDWFSKINEELDELKDAIVCNIYLSNRVDCVEEICAPEKRDKIAEEATDTIAAITSMLEAMGIDEDMRQDAQRRVNEKNRERGRFR